MSSPFQQRALQRKFIYVGLILALFTVALVLRTVDLPALHWQGLESQARALALREQDTGEVELNGRAIQLTLTGLRGLACCILWNSAIEMQKKNQWDELEAVVRSVTKLQPHFITPWMFQSWNLSYNVAVKCDLERDKYFYISRGVDLLAEGERQNQYQPELRFAMGTYYQQKISMADHRIPLQALFEMSGIDPVHRDPDWLRGNDKDGRLRFETYLCEQHPRLMRRLREKLGCDTQEKVYKFLQENRGIPSIFEDQSIEGREDDRHARLKLNKDHPFPLFPQRQYDPMRTPSLEEAGREFDAFAAAAVWYQYAQEPLPPPDPEIPGNWQPVKDPIRQRVPVHMTTIIFRNFPPRAWSYVAERLQEEGWFDDKGWKITGWFRDDRFSNGQPSVVGTGRKWGAESWEKAYQMWEAHGRANHLDMTDSELEAVKRRAELYEDAYDVESGAPAKPLTQEHRDDPEMEASAKAHEIVAGLMRARSLTNFAHFYGRAEVEKRPETIAVRKALFDAEELRLAGRAQALAKYEEALKGWAHVLRDPPPDLQGEALAKYEQALKDFRMDQAVQEDSYGAQLNYEKLFHETPTGRLLKQQTFLQAFMGESAAAALAPSLLSAAKAGRPHAVSWPVVVGPLDIDDRDGRPLITPNNRRVVLARKGIIKQTPPTMPQGMQMRPGMRPPMGGPMPSGMPGTPPAGPEGGPPTSPPPPK